MRTVKLLYIDMLALIDQRAGSGPLIQFSMNDDNEEIREACLERVIQLQAPEALTTYVGALNDENNQRVNRAAVALARLGDPSVIGQLIEALITTHRLAVPGGPYVITTFSDDGPGLSVGNRSPIVIQHMQNKGVLTALITLTEGANFHFDQQAWRIWYESRKQAVSFNAR